MMMMVRRLSDNRMRLRQDVIRNRHVDGLRGLQIDRQKEFRRFNGNISRFSALQDSVGNSRHLLPKRFVVETVGQHHALVDLGFAMPGYWTFLTAPAFY